MTAPSLKCIIRNVSQFYHKFNSVVKKLVEITEKQSFPVLWKFDVFMPDFHNSRNTGERRNLCDNAYTDEH